MNITSTIQYYKDKKLVRLSTNEKNHTIVCYTKTALYNKEWDEFLLCARGLVYDCAGNVLNSPFKKIFNLNENIIVDENIINEKLKNEHYEVYEKCNGHLIQMFFDGEEWIVCTKGSFDMEFISKDKELLIPIIKKIESLDDIRRDYYRKQTLLFEMIVDYDKHLMYKDHKEFYGDNVPVLLGVLSLDGKDLKYIGLQQCADEIQCLCVRKFDKKIDLNTIYDEKYKEGYIVRFDDGFRFKIKTKWYIKQRYYNQFTTEKILKLFKKYEMDYKGVLEEIPEEILYVYEDFCHKFCDYAMEYKKESNKIFNNLLFNNDKKTDIELINKNVPEKFKSAVKSLYNNKNISTKTIKAQFYKTFKYR